MVDVDVGGIGEVEAAEEAVVVLVAEEAVEVGMMTMTAMEMVTAVDVAVGEEEVAVTGTMIATTKVMEATGGSVAETEVVIGGEGVVAALVVVEEEVDGVVITTRKTPSRQ